MKPPKNSTSKTAHTLHAQEPVLEQPALQVVVEILLDEGGQRSAFSVEPCQKPGEVGLNDPVEWGLFAALAIR